MLSSAMETGYMKVASIVAGRYITKDGVRYCAVRSRTC